MFGFSVITIVCCCADCECWVWECDCGEGGGPSCPVGGYMLGPNPGKPPIVGLSRLNIIFRHQLSFVSNALYAYCVPLIDFHHSRIHWGRGQRSRRSWRMWVVTSSPSIIHSVWNVPLWAWVFRRCRNSKLFLVLAVISTSIIAWKNFDKQHTKCNYKYAPVLILS